MTRLQLNQSLMDIGFPSALKWKCCSSWSFVPLTEPLCVGAASCTQNTHLAQGNSLAKGSTLSCTTNWEYVSVSKEPRRIRMYVQQNSKLPEAKNFVCPQLIKFAAVSLVDAEVAVSANHYWLEDSARCDAHKRQGTSLASRFVLLVVVVLWAFLLDGPRVFCPSDVAAAEEAYLIYRRRTSNRATDGALPSGVCVVQHFFTLFPCPAPPQ